MVIGLFWPRFFFNPPMGGPTYVFPLWDPNLISFFLISLSKLFWVSIYWRFLLIFDPCDFLSPGGWTNVCGTLWDFWVSFFFLHKKDTGRKLSINRGKKYIGKKYIPLATKGSEWVRKKNILTEKKIYRVWPKGVSEWQCNLFPEKKIYDTFDCTHDP